MKKEEIKSIDPTNQCFDDAFEFIETELIRNHLNPKPLLKYRLVHAVCLLPDGEPYAHCWLEDNKEVVFKGLINGTTEAFIFAEKKSFYKETRVQRKTVYTMMEM